MATIKELMSLDFNTFNSMTKKDLKAAVRTVGDVVAKRYNRLKEKGLKTPALYHFEETGKGKISVKGKDVNQLRAELARGLDFVKAKTSTIKGYNEFRSNVIDNLKEKGGVDLSEADFDTFWQVYDKLKEVDPYVATHSMRYLAMEDLIETMKNGELNVGEIVDEMREKIKKSYEGYQENLIEATGLSRFFDF